jgi:hypothetical protein
MRMRTPTTFLAAIGLATIVAGGCASSKNRPGAETAGQCANKGARTGVAGAKTGVLTGVEGVKAAGGAVGGFVEGGSDEASHRWKEGKAQTKATAHEGRDDTKGEANASDCQ